MKRSAHENGYRRPNTLPHFGTLHMSNSMVLFCKHKRQIERRGKGSTVDEVPRIPEAPNLITSLKLDFQVVMLLALGIP
ncbi:hypothetical protein EYC80_010040 [Monilinia laxa]|uniref:Uncharacterized protein n=1 Tax=Monilinia laxa TaxID=61186 RepID=A0A5N6JS41_MONLA|nr:hypothetical protein EYC80_010040 [Monilinia laxa]